MAEITAAAVKELRERTGAGMMDCKKALAETGGDMEAAIDWLRTKGLAAAAKKAGRIAAEGLIGVAVVGTMGAVVEVNSETDFVAKNEQFQDFVRNVAQIALATGDDVEELGRGQYPGHGTVGEMLTSNIATIGENQSIRRAARLEVGGGVVVSYVHNAVAPGLGSDVPACLLSMTARGTGAGDDLELIDAGVSGRPVLLVNPGMELSTAEVFARWDGRDRGPLGDWREGRNDLESAANALAPEIADVLEWLRGQAGASFARMSGSGATCFALFADDEARDAAAAAVPPRWWHLVTHLR